MDLTSKLFKSFLQSRERSDLIVVFVIHYLINCYDNPAKNHCSERDPPRLRSEHKFHGISLLINLYTVIYIHRRLSCPVPVFAQIGAIGSQTNQADSNKPDAIRQNQGVILRIIIFYYINQSLVFSERILPRRKKIHGIWNKLKIKIFVDSTPKCNGQWPAGH